MANSTLKMEEFQDSNTTVSTFTVHKPLSNALAIFERKKLSDEVKKYLKKNFEAHWMNNPDADPERLMLINRSGVQSIPIKYKAFATAYLYRMEVQFNFEPFYDPYFEKDEKGRKVERLEQAKVFKAHECMGQVEHSSDLLSDFNNLFGFSLTQKDVEEGSEVIRSIEEGTNERHKECLQILREELKKVSKKREIVKEVEERIKNISKEEGIIIEGGKIHESVDAASRLLKDSQVEIYQRANRLVRAIEVRNDTKKNVKTIKDKHGEMLLFPDGIKRAPSSLIIEEVDQSFLVETLTKFGTFKTFDGRKKEYKVIDCPDKIARHLISRKKWDDVHYLNGIVQAPTLRRDGSILQTPGYDEASGIYFHSETIFPEIPENLSRDDAIVALGIFKNLLRGFPFENETFGEGKNFSVALSAILTALVRKSIATSPLHGFSAPKMGSGKSLLADVVSLIATGRRNSVLPPVDNETEERKRLMSVLLEGDAIACYDNIEHPFGSAALCCVLTQPEYKDRILGLSKSVTAPTNMTFLATGNNLRFVGDLSTRALLCRIDANEERPEERSFDVNLHDHIPRNRGEIVKAALTILGAYTCAGCPKQGIKTFGRFEEWSDLIRSAIIWIGCADPCESRKEIENDDPERVKIGNLFVSWYEIFGDRSQKVKDVIRRAQEESEQENEDLQDALLEMALDNKGGVNPRSLGKQLAKHNKRIEQGYQLEKMPTKIQHVETWRIKKI